MTRVVNKKYHKPTPDDVYIGRGSKWGNPFKIGVDGDRHQVIEKYQEYFKAKLESGYFTKDEILKLSGKNLVCFCKPAACHGDIIVKYINELK